MKLVIIKQLHSEISAKKILWHASHRKYMQIKLEVSDIWLRVNGDLKPVPESSRFHMKGKQLDNKTCYDHPKCIWGHSARFMGCFGVGYVFAKVQRTIGHDDSINTGYSGLSRS